MTRVFLLLLLILAIPSWGMAPLSGEDNYQYDVAQITETTQNYTYDADLNLISASESQLSNSLPVHAGGGLYFVFVDNFLATKRTANEAGVVREFATKADQTFYRVFSGDNSVGGFVTAVKPKSSAFAREALALPRANHGNLVQEVLVPAGTRVRRSRAASIRANETFPNRRGGAEQFELLDRIPTGNFGSGSSLR